MINDEATRLWVTTWLNEQDWVLTATTFTKEDGGADIVYITSAGTHNCELKSQRKYHYEAWDADNVNVSFTDTPKTNDTNATYTNNYTGDCRYNVPEKGDTPDKFEGKKFFIVNADNANGEFMKEHSNPNYNCKWLKILKNKWDLIILYKDGMYLISNDDIRKRFLGYIRYKEREWTNNTGYYKSFNNSYRWGIKGCIELGEDGFLYMDDIPHELFEKN